MESSKLISDFIPLMRPSILEEDIAAVVKVLRSGMLVQGTEVDLLEQRLTHFFDTPSTMVANGTATLHLALVALGIGSGDEVIVPAFSYIATANVVELVGATPIFVDIDLRSYNIDVLKIEEKISSRTKAIIPVHEFGLACDISEIVRIATLRNIYVIEDAACALGSTVDGRPVGTFGTFGSFSFHPRKAITSGEGGALICDEKALIDSVRALRNHGIESVNNKQEFTKAGFNYRMTDFQAALLQSQLNRLEKILFMKNELAQVYFNEIQSQNILLPVVPDNKKHSWQTFHTLLADGIVRDLIITKLKSKGIGSNYGAQCIPAQKFYQEKYHLECEKLFPNALHAYNNGLAIPMYDGLSKEKISYVAKTLNNII
jgi:perosamine synthetase